MGRVLFSGLGSGFGFWDLARVGSRVNDFWARVSKIWFGSSSGQVFFSFFSQFWPNSWMVEQCKQKSLVKWWSSACQIKMLFNSGSRVGQNYTSGCSGFQNHISGRVGLAKKASDRVKSRVGFWPDPSLIAMCSCTDIQLHRLLLQ